MTSPRTGPFFAAGLLACLWLWLSFQLGAQWSAYEQYRYGWAVPFLCAYLFWRRWQSRPKGASPGSPKAALALLALAALIYLPTRFLQEENPIWRLTSLLWTLEVIAFTLCFIYLAGGFPWLRHFWFPFVFFLVAVPWPSALENALTQSLMRLNVATTVELLSLFGVPAVQHGNVIELRTGVVGIDEACSGIRSLQATLMLSLFLGELYALSARRRALCLFGGFVFSFLFNVGRTLLLAQVASSKGVGAVASWHDPAGVTILVGCFLSLWALAVGLKRGKSAAQASSPASPASVPVWPHPPSSIFHLRWVSTALCAWLLLVETGTEFWYRLHERGVGDQAKWSVRWPNNQPAFRVVNIPPSIRGQFQYDEGVEGRWQDANGGDWQLYYFRWFPAGSLQKRVSIQLAKTHGPETCLPAMGMSPKSGPGNINLRVEGMDLAMQQYEFTAEDRPLHVFYGIYEDPSGSATLANRRKDCASRVAAALAGSRNYGQRFLEVAVSGYEKPEDAKSALLRELGMVIEVEK